MRLAKICKGGCGNKPAMWIDGGNNNIYNNNAILTEQLNYSGIHAREWVSPAVVMFMLKELVENDSDHQDLLENIDWYNFQLNYSTITTFFHFMKVYFACGQP